MSEVAGLTFGTIALASLFTNCIELFDYFELARNYARDHHTASVKLGLLRERLRGWGNCLHLLEPGNESPELREHWDTKSDAITNGLLKLRRLLSDSELLLQRYQISKISQRSLKLRKRTVWAIHDRAKFDRLIQDISFLIENLEKVTSTEVNLSKNMGSPQRSPKSDGNKANIGKPMAGQGSGLEPSTPNETQDRNSGDNIPREAQRDTNIQIAGNTSAIHTQTNRDDSSGTLIAVLERDTPSETHLQANSGRSRGLQASMSKGAFQNFSKDYLETEVRINQAGSSDSGPSAAAASATASRR